MKFQPKTFICISLHAICVPNVIFRISGNSDAAIMHKIERNDIFNLLLFLQGLVSDNTIHTLFKNNGIKFNITQAEGTGLNVGLLCRAAPPGFVR